jgi:hypothetical protein
VARFFPPNEMAEMQAQEERLRAYETFKAMASPQTASSVAALASTYPHAKPGTVLALGKAGVAPGTPIAQAAAKAEAKRGFGWHSVGDAITGAVAKVGSGLGAVADQTMDVVKGVSRGMDIGLSSVGQTFQGAMRASTRDGDIQGAEWLMGLPHLAKGFSQTSLAAGHREVQREGGYLGLLTGSTDVNYGSGFFAGGDVEADAVARRRAVSLTSAGKAVTVGRYTAGQVFEPGTRWYATLSGLIDAGVALGSDPTIPAGGAIKAAAAAGRVLDTAGGTSVVVARASGSPAKRAAREFGEQRRSPEDFIAGSDSFGSDNSGVNRILRSRDEGLLSSTEAQSALATIRPNIAVAGGLDEAPRKTVLPEKVAEWLDSKDGRRLRDYLISETSFERMRQATKGKIDAETLVRLADATDDATVLDVLGPQLGVQIRDKFGVSRAALAAADGSNGFLARRVAGNRTRLGAQMPGTHMDLENVDRAVDEVSRWGRNVKMKPEQIGVWTEKMARADGVNGRFAVTREMLASVRDDILAESGSKVSQRQKTELTRMYDNYDVDLRRYAIDAVGENARVPGAIIDGQGKALPTAHLFVEYVNGSVPMPDARELRRATSNYVRLIDNAKLRGAYDGSNAIADFVTQQAFKPLVLLRGAWTVRVVGEEQIRLAASGMTSAFAHPLSHIALAMGRKGGQDIKGDMMSLADEHIEAMSRGSAGWKDRKGTVRIRDRVVLNRDDPNHAPRFAEALADEIGKMHSDPIVRRVLNGLGDGDLTPTPGLTGIDAVKDWFFNGTGRSLKDDIRAADKDGDRAWLDVKVADDGGINSADGYIDSLLERAKTTAGGDQRILDAIATGQINGKPLTAVTAGGQRVPNRVAIKELQKVLNEGAGPQHVPGSRLVHVKDGAASDVIRMYDQAVETAFNTLMSRPTNFLSRSPAFQQFYWKRNAEMIPMMDPETQQQAIRVARETGLPSKLIKQMEQRAKSGSGSLNVADADTVAKAFALDSTRRLLYDLTDRNQFFDVTRVIFPFGEAWKEVATTWARIATVDNPVALRRAQQVVTGLRSADSDGDGEGFFYTDPQTGEEMFNYPFSGWINEKLTGMPGAFKAPAQGLNIFATSVIPGVGPVVQLSVGRIIPERPEWDQARELILPFGEKDTSGGIAESFLPAWLQKWRTAMGKNSAGQDRMFANTVMHMSRYLVSTGEYSMDSPEEQDRLLNAATSRAKRLFAIRGAAQFFAPSPPSPEFVAKDKNGDALLSIRMVEEYRKLQDEDYRTATERFIEKFGEDAFLTTVSMTSGGGQPSQQLYDFVREHPEVPRQHKDVYGYFISGDGEFNGDAYAYQLRTGQRKPIAPQEALQIANQRLGSMVYRQVRASLGEGSPNKEQRVWLAKVRDAIVEEYPGYNPIPATLDEQKALIQNLMRAADNPILARTEAGQALFIYKEARTEAVELARSRGYSSFDRADGTVDIRRALRTLADQLGEQYPAFVEMFDRTLNREMKTDDDDKVAA